MLLRSFQAIHVARAKFKEHVLKEHKEHRRLVRESAKMSDDDYEHAGPVDKTDEEIAKAQQHRQELQDSMTSLKSELSACLCYHLYAVADTQHLLQVLCSALLRCTMQAA